ncbi:phosphoribosylformylglycinamidine synthase, purS [Alkaliphilus metalliredigens QYMF]|uniref:Phosphoribosylformylglycinamidine synthase subunit PurS n=1 Tax=Alkaliphilus metalliredigens (strain QYMF) TaxID=293826 RepID=A6TLS1_ALKMQ|nr:phosphoribosylformylglycinamidine synthase subunit PurS [Alkaliphilus metalliredigens]ABR47139.1 phosphoribosylformylglycinamidine synthase, purS [Alkaliphilus metalliredigens QYMF]
MKVNIFVTLKDSIADPQGNAIHGALKQLDYKNVEDVRIGKLIEVVLGDISKEEAEKQLQEMCKKLLTNPVIENYRYEWVD